MNWKLKLHMLLLAGLLTACGGGSDEPGGSNPDPEPELVPSPSAATLIFPDNNRECTTGVVVSDTRSQVLFEWNNSENTDSYEVNLRNLNTNITSRFNSNTNSANITLDRGTPYEWFVVSRADGTSETANSVSWRFYNEGPGIENYAPFPAVAVSPPRGASIDVDTSVTLEWEGSDVDNDISNYEVFFGTDSAALASIGSTTETSLETGVNPGTLYYWRVITNDSQGNSSQSELFEFLVN